jgi:hypothetical protein
MDSFEEFELAQFCARLHRTWLAVLLEADKRELAALVVDAELDLMRNDWGTYGIHVDPPPTALTYVDTDGTARQTLENTLRTVARGRLQDSNGSDIDDPTIAFRVKLLDVEDDWRAVVKDLMVNAKEGNQGLVSEKAFTRHKRQVLTYNEMKFASQAEIRIAQEFERRKVLFFPLPLAVRHETGVLHKDHREVDFLVCQAGAWGVLEVAYHPDRYERDTEKDAWLKKSGLLCIQHYTAERCYEHPAQVVEEFLSILAQHKR